MTKAERILEFVHKIANKEHITYEQAEQLAITCEYIKYIEGDMEMIVDNTQHILNSTVQEILDDSNSEKAIPTDAEIDQVVEYFKHKNSREAYEKYLAPLIKKHGEKWVDGLVYAVMSNIISGVIK